MKRRDFLQSAGLITAAAVLPGWLTDKAWEPPKGPDFQVALATSNEPWPTRNPKLLGLKPTMEQLDQMLNEIYIPKLREQLYMTNPITWDGESDITFPKVRGTVTHVVATQGGETYIAELPVVQVGFGHDITMTALNSPEAW